MLTRLPRSSWSLTTSAHLLNRAGFGGTPEHVGALHKLGCERAVDAFLDGKLPFATKQSPPSRPAWLDGETDPEEEEIKEKIQALRGKRPKANDLTGEQQAEERRKLQRMIRQIVSTRSIELNKWWFETLCTTEHPLKEKITLFWHGHFVSSLEKVRAPKLMLEQNELFRKMGMGDSRELTRRMARNPAMVLYLDLNNSRAEKPNENYARELLELFTLGEGHYTENDIKEAARAFTGLRLNRETNEVSFNPRAHDKGSKTFLGKAGKHGADDIVEIIFSTDRASEFLSHKLLRYFVIDTPPDDLVNQLAAELRRNDFNIRRTLRTLFLSAEFYSRPFLRGRIKSPVEFLVQISRQLELDRIPEKLAVRGQRDLGQILFRPPNVAGWPGGKRWINTNTLLNRYNLAGVLARGHDDPNYAMEVISLTGKGMGKNRNIKNPKVREAIAKRFPRPDFATIAPAQLRGDSEKLIESLTFRFFQYPVRQDDHQRFLSFAETKHESGKTITDTELAELIHLMLSTPYYQLT